MAKKIHFGVLGLSRVAKKNVLPALVNSAHAELVAIGSRDPEKARTSAEEYGVAAFGTYEDVLARSDIDAVYISLPNNMHEEWVIRAAKAGKHVWCEKPAALSYASAQLMVAACKERGVRLMEGFMLVHHPQHEHVRNLISRGELGDLISFSGNFSYPMPEKGSNRLNKRLDGGCYWDAAVYPIRASWMIFDAEPESISCELAIDPEYGVDTRASMLLTYPKRRSALISAAFGASFRSTYEILGSTGHLTATRAYAVPKDMAVHLLLESNDAVRDILIPAADHFEIQISGFCQELLASTDKRPHENDLLLQARILEAGIRSQTEHRTVNLSEIR